MRPSRVSTLKTKCSAPTAAVSSLERANAAAHLAGQPLRNLLNERAIAALPHGRVQVDELHHGVAQKTLDPVFEIVEGQLQIFALHQLHDAAAHQIDGRNQHGSLTGTP